MSDEYPQAISFANNYFALVDGLAPGLEEHLAQNVVLDWFGRTIRGKANVTAFMKAHKVASRHVFPNITPTASIGYRKCHTIRKRPRKRINSVENRDITDSTINSQLNFEKLAIHDPNESEYNNNVRKPDDDGELSLSSDSVGNQIDEDEMTYELNENDLTPLFNLEIMPTRIEEIEENINKIKQEETVPRVAVVKRECGQGDGPSLMETSCIKYVEANGQIEFSKKSLKRGTEMQTWRRQCKVQIAYSMIKTETCPYSSPSEEMQMDHPPYFSQSKTENLPKRRLLSLEEITELSSNLVPNINNFGGYLQNFDFAADRDCFLENFNSELSVKHPATHLLSPHYVENRLVFREPRPEKKQEFKRQENKFIFNYAIHLIIYEGSNRCRRNLTPELK